MYKSLKKIENNNGYRILADAIILQAVKDYRDVLAAIKKGDCKKEYEWQKRSIENFFSSEWFRELTPINGRMIARKLRAEVMGNDC